MAKKKIDIQIKSWGIYSQWDRSSKALPKITKFTETIPCELDIEFGYILHQVKNKPLLHLYKSQQIPQHPQLLSQEREKKRKQRCVCVSETEKKERVRMCMCGFGRVQ